MRGIFDGRGASAGFEVRPALLFTPSLVLMEAASLCFIGLLSEPFMFVLSNLVFRLLIQQAVGAPKDAPATVDNY